MAKGKRRNDWNPDLGLAILAATSKPPHTYRTIAAYMGISWQRVWQIEQKALRKVRAGLHRNAILEKELQTR